VVRLLACLAFGGCADAPCADGSMLDGPGGLVVTRAEHPTGWGDDRCAECHAFDALHLEGCTPLVDLDEAQAEVDREGADACATCHGANGAAP
jgi:hypothetical protein